MLNKFLTESQASAHYTLDKAESSSLAPHASMLREKTNPPVNYINYSTIPLLRNPPPTTIPPQAFLTY